MKLYFVESYDPGIKFEKNASVIALTPRACYEFDKLGIKYSIVEDYYSEKELLADEGEYFQEQLSAIEEIDEFILGVLPEVKRRGLKIGSEYSYFLKTTMDTVYIRSFVLGRIFAKLRAENVNILTETDDTKDLEFTLSHNGESIYTIILRKICEKYNIPFKKIGLKKLSKDDNAYVDDKEGSSQPTTIKNRLSKIKIARQMHYFINEGKKSVPRQRTRRRLNIFLLKTGYNGSEIIKDGLKAGHNIFSLDGTSIVKHTVFGPRKYRQIREFEGSTATGSKKNGKMMVPDYAGKLKMINWFNGRCALDVSDIIARSIEHLIVNICPQILFYLEFFDDWFRTEPIDYIITPHKWSPLEFSALISAEKSSITKRVGIQHGNEIFLNRFWYWKELSDYDIFICTDYEIREHFKKLCKTYNLSTRVFSSHHRLLPMKMVRELREKETSGTNGMKSSKESIIYLPTVFMWDRRRLDGAEYPDTWYYRFQKELIGYLSGQKKYKFIWKGMPQADAVDNPIPDFIKSSDFENIEIATNPFREHVHTVDRVITDFPCTGFYESHTAGIPTVAIYYDSLKVRKRAREYFKNVLRSFSQINESFKYVEEFLKSDPEKYRIEIKMDNKSVIDILEEEKRLSIGEG